MNSSHGMFSQQQQQQQQQHQPTPQQQQQQPLQMVPPAMQQQFSMQQQLQQQQLLRAQQQQTAAPNSIGAAAAQLQPGLVLSQLQGFMAGQPPAQLPPGAASGQPLGQQAAMPQSPGMQPPGVRPLAPPPAAAMLAAISLPPLAPQPAAAVTAAAGAQAAQPPSAAAAAAAAAGGSAGAAAEDPRFEKVGYAKLLGEGLEYYIKKYEIVLGRKSKAAVDVVLGDSAVLSRQHCRIIYNFTTKKWQLVVEGKNGVTVNGTLYTPASGPCNLASQDLLQAGDMSFYFLLPKPPRKPKAKPAAAAAAGAATPAGQASAGATAGGAAGQQQQHNQQNVPGTPVLGAGAAAAAGQLQGSSPMLPGFSPRLPQAGAMLPGLSPAAGAAGGAEGLQHFSSGPLLGGLGPGGFPGVQAYPGGVNMAGSQDLLQPGLGDDDGMMDV